MEIPQEFNDWWNADKLTQTNPFEDDTPAYWAWEGWQAALASKASKGAVPEAVKAMAYRTLWLAFVWNDHNFDAAHKYALREAKEWGLNSFDEANAFLESLAAPSPAQLAQIEHRAGCDALGGYGQGVGPCSCGVQPGTAE